jgi:S1-C subfamily serine protease
MRATERGRWPESGFAHLLLLAVVLVVAAVAIVALYDSAQTPTSERARSRSSEPGTGPTMPPTDSETVARKVGPAIVDIEVSLAGGGHASATGMVVTPAGEVVTNNHSIAGATAITARIAGAGPTYAATVLGYDVTDDVAVLGLAGASGLPTIENADSSALAGGEPVVVIGNTAGVDGAPTPLAAVVTARGRQVVAGAETLSGMVEIDVATRASDSGGAVADAGAKVVAMTTAAPGGGRFHEQTSENVTFAIPIEGVFAVVDRVDAGQSTNTVHVGPRASLGVAVRPTSPDGDSGAYVVSVQGDGPAARAGIVADTIVVSIDETTISTTAALDTTLDHYRPGDVVRLGWVGRDGSYRSTDVQLGSGPPG